MKLKTIEVQVDGKPVTVAVLDDKGLPVYIHNDGKEVGFDALQATTKISNLNGEAQGHREAKEAAELALKGFEGIEDAAAALAAIETVKNLASGELTTAAKVQEIKDAAKRAAEEQVQAAVKAKDEELKRVSDERDGIQSAFHNELIGGGFSRSKFISDKIAIPADLMQAQFGRAFKVEDNKLVAYGPDGKKVFSRTRAGEVAEFDEALEELVNAYPNRDHILKGGIGGGGGSGGGGGGGGNGNTMLRADFLKLAPEAARAVVADQAAGKVTIVDA